MFQLEKFLLKTNKLIENFNTIIETIVKAKPQSSKGTYLRNVVITSTMGPGIKIDTSGYTAH